MLRDYLLGPRARRGWLAVFVALCVVTLVVALLPAPRAPGGTGWDKLDHLLAFAALGVVGVLALRATLRGALLVLTLLVVLGAAIEGLQSLVPSRQADPADFIADLLGALGGTMLAWLLARKAEPRDSPPASGRSD
jgi:VanZ family protein